MAVEALLRPDSVAVIGVSEDPNKLGSRVLQNLVSGGFAGRIHAVGRGRGSSGACFVPDIGLLAEPVDLAFIAVPANAVVTVAQQCAARGVRAIIVGAAGFAEDGDAAGVARQAALTQLCHESGMRLLGPNCNGLYNPHRRLSLGFNTAHGERLAAGDIALLSHSGALFESMVRRFEALDAGLSTFVSVGNEADLDILDLMEHQVADPAARVIAMLIDALPDAERFVRLCGLAREAGKPVVVLKLGGSAAGAEAATAHSSRMVGDAEAYQALFRRCGVAVADTLEGFTTAAALLARFGMRAGGLAAITTSGAGGALLADVAARHKAPMAAYASETEARLNQHRRFSRLVNPTDLGVFGGALPHSAIISAIAEDPGVGAVVFQTHRLPGHGPKTIVAMAESQARTGKAHILLAPGGLPVDELAHAREHGVAVLTETDNAVQALGALLTVLPDRPEFERPPIPAPGMAQLGEHESLQLLARHGLPTNRSRLCCGLSETLDAADALGWPVAVKSAAVGLAHKSEHGLVKLGLRDRFEVAQACSAIGVPGRYIVQPMVEGDLELILGVVRSANSGLTLMAGLGGVFAEALDEAAKWSAPASRQTLVSGLEQCAIGRVMRSSRWRSSMGVGDIADVLLCLQDFAIASRAWLESVDMNPVLVTEDALVAVDALITAMPVQPVAPAGKA